VLTAVIPFLLVLKQPDLGTSIAFVAILFTMLYWRVSRSSISSS